LFSSCFYTSVYSTYNSEWYRILKLCKSVSDSYCKLSYFYLWFYSFVFWYKFEGSKAMRGFNFYYSKICEWINCEYFCIIFISCLCDNGIFGTFLMYHMFVCDNNSFFCDKKSSSTSNLFLYTSNRGLKKTWRITSVYSEILFDNDTYYRGGNVLYFINNFLLKLIHIYFRTSFLIRWKIGSWYSWK